MTPELTALVTRLRSRAWEDRQHRELRELAAQAIVDLSRNDLTPNALEHIGMWRQWGREQRFSAAHLHGYEWLCDMAVRGATYSKKRATSAEAGNEEATK